MNQVRSCGCKGCRSCLLCEEEYNIELRTPGLRKENNSYVYCPFCNIAWPGWNLSDNDHPDHKGESMEYPGIYIHEDFLSEAEEIELMFSIDNMKWDLSQSGRRKQNFGPKCNFKKKKLKLYTFNGFPKSTKFVQDKFSTIPIMDGFQTIEQCSLEYDPQRGASIDPHIDDCWIWGERIVTVNLLSDSVLTMTYNNKPDKYNLCCVSTYNSVINRKAENSFYEVKPFKDGNTYPVIRIPMPRRSLLVMYGPARYDWEHQVLREDIVSRRVCLAYREFTPPYLEHGEKYEIGKDVLLAAKKFCDIQ